MPIGVLTAPFVGVYGPRPYEAQPAQKQTQGSPAMTQVSDEMADAARSSLVESSGRTTDRDGS